LLGATGVEASGSRAVAAAPHRGRSPIAYQVARRDGEPALDLSASLRPAVIEDLLFVLAGD
jgi:hypothetical protein